MQFRTQGELLGDALKQPGYQVLLLSFRTSDSNVILSSQPVEAQADQRSFF